MALIIGSELSVSAQGVTVRGQLIRVGPAGYYPAVGVAVSIATQLGRGAPTVTGYDGMYYMYNILPGYYTLEVWSTPPMQFPITVQFPYTDIPQVRVP